MCIGIWSLDHPNYALILCTNRDEYLSRPTVNAHFHSFSQEPHGNFVLSGRDLQAGGSWFGINRAGRIALLTNISEQGAPFKSSRGHLVSSFLLPDALDSELFVDSLVNDTAAEYAGFNLLLLMPSREEGRVSFSASLITNSGGGGAIKSRPLLAEERRIGGISNGIDGDDGQSWPKVRKGEQSLNELLYDNAIGRDTVSEEELVEQLFETLLMQADPPPNNRFQLRTSIHIPPLRMSASLSPDAEPVNRHDLYGTRLSTVLLVKRNGSVLFIERDVWKIDAMGEAIRGDTQEERSFRFTLHGFKGEVDDLEGEGKGTNLN